MPLLAVALAFAGVAAWLAAIAVVDGRTGRIPHRLVLPAVAGTVVVAVALPVVGLSAAALVLPYLVAFAMRTCGGGDVKLAVPCGGLLADPALAVAAALCAAVGTVLVCTIAKRSRQPHGPVLVAVTVLLMLLK